MTKTEKDFRAGWTIGATLGGRASRMSRKELAPLMTQYRIQEEDAFMEGIGDGSRGDTFRLTPVPK